MQPERLGPYRILGLLGRGGLGVVYRARDERTHEEVAVKLLTSATTANQRSMRRFVREFEALAEFDHPHVIRVIDFGVAGDVPYFAMELIDGLDIKRHLDGVSVDVASWRSADRSPVDISSQPRTVSMAADSEDSGWAARAFDLEAWMEEPDSDVLMERTPITSSGSLDLGVVGPAPSVDQPYDQLASEPEPIDIPEIDDRQLEHLNNPVRVNRIRELLAQVCQALAYVHSRGLVHRDLKPSNIMVDTDGDARLMDFGLIKTIAEAKSVTDSGRVVGTYRYMSPEQAGGDHVDARSDLYGLGVVLYELLCGHPPFAAKHPLELWRQLMESEPPPLRQLNPHVEVQLARVAHVLLRKDPADRLQTAEEVEEELLA